LILIDSSAVFALLDRDSADRERIDSFLSTDRDTRLMSPFVLAELDYLISKRFGRRAELDLLSEVAGGAYRLAQLSNDDVARAREIIGRYDDKRISLTDASIVVLAERYETNRVLTLDERHFRAMRVKGKKFVVLPADA
jgi:predicted nucleic acid-binding protein